MPIYEYACRECRADFEALVPANRRDDESMACPQCRSNKIARKISLTAAHVVKSGKTGGSSEAFSCGAPSCCGGSCMMD